MTLVLTRAETTALVATRVKRFRPQKFRSILRIDNSVPAWAEHIEVAKVEMYADVKPMNIGGSDALPKPSIARSSGTLRLYEYGMAYDLRDTEVERARKLGMDLPALKSLANQTATETKLDEIAAGAETLIGFPGLANNSAITPGTPTAVWGSTDFDPETALQDLHDLVNAVAEQSKENFTADTVVLPLAKYHYVITARLGDGTDRTVLEAFRAQSPYVRRILAWNRLATLGANGATRAVAFDSQAPEGPRMIIPRELTDDQPRRMAFGTEIAQSFVVAGVLIEADETIAYLDGI